MKWVIRIKFDHLAIEEVSKDFKFSSSVVISLSQTNFGPNFQTKTVQFPSKLGYVVKLAFIDKIIIPGSLTRSMLN